jgi:hypothetical protein
VEPAVRLYVPSVRVTWVTPIGRVYVTGLRDREPITTEVSFNDQAAVPAATRLIEPYSTSFSEGLNLITLEDPICTRGTFAACTGTVTDDVDDRVLSDTVT